MMDIILEQLLDPWVIFGFTAQGLFFGRFIVQWIASERAKQTEIPVSFWYLSIVGALMITVYAVHRQDIVFIVGQVLALIIYIRNLSIYYKAKRRLDTSDTR